MQINKKQSGVFSIEMAFVLIGMCACLYFCFNLGYQQIKKSQLERVSYSLVSVLKERTLLYRKDKNDNQYELVNASQVEQLKSIGAKLLGTDKNKISVVVDYRIEAINKPRVSALAAGIECTPLQTLSNKLDVTLEKGGRPAPIYQVTICQQVPAWFESVIGGEKPKNKRILQAQSSFVGR